MNEKLNLVEILKNCPEGTDLYSIIFGEVKFNKIEEDHKYPITFTINSGEVTGVTSEGRHFVDYNGECTLFPSKEQRDWSKLKDKLVESKFKDRDSVPNKFDPKTFQPFDRVLVRRGSENYDVWFPDFVSDPPDNTNNKTLCMCIMEDIAMVIPYNDDTKHLVGTTDEAPEFYCYWED